MDGTGKPYEQVAASLRERIAVGEWNIGDRLPTNRELADAYQVAPNTVGNALDVLRKEGLIFSQQGKGTFVRARPDGTAASRPSSEFVALTAQLDEFQEELREMRDRLARLEAAVGTGPTDEPQDH